MFSYVSVLTINFSLDLEERLIAVLNSELDGNEVEFMRRTIIFEVSPENEDTLDAFLTRAARQKVRERIRLLPPEARARGATKALAELLGCTRQRAARLLDALNLRAEFDAQLEDRGSDAASQPKDKSQR